MSEQLQREYQAKCGAVAGYEDELAAAGVESVYELRLRIDGLEAKARLLAAENACYARSHAELLKQLTLLVDSIEDAGGHDENGDVFDVFPACSAIEVAESFLARLELSQKGTENKR